MAAYPPPPLPEECAEPAPLTLPKVSPHGAWFLLPTGLLITGVVLAAVYASRSYHAFLEIGKTMTRIEEIPGASVFHADEHGTYRLYFSADSAIDGELIRKAYTVRIEDSHGGVIPSTEVQSEGTIDLDAEPITPWVEFFIPGSSDVVVRIEPSPMHLDAPEPDMILVGPKVKPETMLAALRLMIFGVGAGLVSLVAAIASLIVILVMRSSSRRRRLAAMGLDASARPVPPPPPPPPGV